MNKYEIMFIVKTDIDEKTQKDVVKTFEKVLTDMKAKINNTKDMGQKKLAYPIKKELNGYYFLMQFEANKDIEAEINRKARLDENVLRHLIIKLDEE